MPTNAINDTGVKYIYDKLHSEIEGCINDIEDIDDIITTDTSTIEGNPLNFSTLSAQNAESTIIDLEPIQDLHGYDKPWAGGNGKNKLPYPYQTTSTTKYNTTWVDNGDGSVTVSTTSDGASSNNSFPFFGSGSQAYSLPRGTYKLTGCPSGGSESTYRIQLAHAGEIDTWDTGDGGTFEITAETEVIGVAIYVYKNAVISEPITFYPMIRPASIVDDTWEPYANNCPIVGRISVGLEGYDNNLFSYLQFYDNYVRTGTGSYYNLGRHTYQLKPNTNYVASTNISEDATAEVFWWAGDYDDVTPSTNNHGVTKNTTRTITTDNTGLATLAMYVDGNAKVLESNFIDNTYWIKIEEGSTATPYICSNNIAYNFNQTVYGGTLDVESGVLTIGTGYIEYDGSVDEEWQIDSSGRPYLAFIGVKPVETNSSIVHAISNEFRTLSRNGVVNSDSAFGYSTSKNWIFKNVEGTASVSDWRTYLSNNPVEIAYELETPITIQLTPHAIEILKGLNNFSTDGDSISLTYRVGEFATLGDLESAKAETDVKIAESQILVDTVTGDKYILVVSNGVLDIQQVSN